MADRHILILGGSGEARQLAARLAMRPELRVTVSLAGRTRTPLPQAGCVRTGGFGGAEGLAQHLRTAEVSVLVDATHPFARRISANAVTAATAAGIPLVTLRRPPWRPVSGDRWTEVADIPEAVIALGVTPRRVFLAIGRQELAPFRAAPQHRYLVRSVDPVAPEADLPDADHILAGGPFAEEAEAQLLGAHRIEAIVAKNSGGAATYGKIAAARLLRLPVILVRRPSEREELTTVEAAEARIAHLLPPARRGV